MISIQVNSIEPYKEEGPESDIRGVVFQDSDTVGIDNELAEEIFSEYFNCSVEEMLYDHGEKTFTFGGVASIGEEFYDVEGYLRFCKSYNYEAGDHLIKMDSYDFLDEEEVIEDVTEQYRELRSKTNKRKEYLERKFDLNVSDDEVTKTVEY